MKSILFIGECMLELSPETASTYRRSYAGDTYNSAVYAKRLVPELNIAYLTALGCDAISDSMLAAWESEGIDTSQVLRSVDLGPGLYAITTDEAGERSFVYWRKQSAATQMMALLAQRGGAATVPDTNYVYFSGISLSILDDAAKTALLELLVVLRERGAKVVFDPNYRPAMWPGLEEARGWMQKAYALCDIALPGLDDHLVLFGHESPEAIQQYLNGLQVGEMVIKCGTAGMYGFSHQDEPCYLPFSPAKQQVDSTAAGDSFAGVYVARRLQGDTMLKSIIKAAAVASLVVQHSGAIIKKGILDSLCADGG